ncbi:hypothetical protein D3C77_365740 [compost metagenome]
MPSGAGIAISVISDAETSVLSICTTPALANDFPVSGSRTSTSSTPVGLVVTAPVTVGVF